MVSCPQCDGEFKDLRGLYGHLRFKHALQGEELERVYGKAKEEQQEQQEVRKVPTYQEVREMVGKEVSEQLRTALEKADLDREASEKLERVLQGLRLEDEAGEEESGSDPWWKPQFTWEGEESGGDVESSGEAEEQAEEQEKKYFTWE